MAVYTSLKIEDPGAIVTCDCGCGSGVEFRVIHINDDDTYALGTFFSGSFYLEQYSGFDRFLKKCRKIWAVITNKDYQYTDILMSKKEWNTFKEIINNA